MVKKIEIHRRNRSKVTWGIALTAAVSAALLAYVSLNSRTADTNSTIVPPALTEPTTLINQKRECVLVYEGGAFRACGPDLPRATYMLPPDVDADDFFADPDLYVTTDN